MIVLALACAAPAAAQIPDEFTNLKLLPKEIGREELLATMRSFADALGVRCKFCHVSRETPDGERDDFASDEPEHKRIARGMIKMVDELNRKLLPAATGEDGARVRCVTCHRGLAEPETLEELLLEVAEEDGVEASIARYHELRRRYYGSGSYDFGPGTLNQVADGLARGKDVPGALKIVGLNVETHPQSAEPHLLQAQLLAAQGEREQALACVERALAIEPDNRHAQRLRDKLRSSD